MALSTMTTRPLAPARLASAVGCGLALALGSLSSPAAAQSLGAPIELSVSAPPVPASAAGKTHLVYELHVTNYSSRAFTVTSVDVLSVGGDAAPLASYSGAALDAALNRPGLAPAAEGAPPPDRKTIGGGMLAVVRIWVTVEPAAVPKSLRHRLSFAYVDASGAKKETAVEGCTVDVARESHLVLSSPFRDGTWIAGNGPSNTSDHRRTMVPIDGRARIAQRFAIDWVKLGDNGLPYHDDPSKNANWYGYGQELLAGADATVVEVKDGVVENTPLSPTMAVPITLETVAGNHVTLDLGGGYYALYAHLQPGSLRVKVGDRVRRGQVLGLLGNSGNSDAPHLHFHVTDGPSPLGSEGVPYALERFEELGKIDDVDALIGGAAWKAAAAPAAHAKEIPLENVVVRF
jgi:murein DD-endopeptidase